MITFFVLPGLFGNRIHVDLAIGFQSFPYLRKQNIHLLHIQIRRILIDIAAAVSAFGIVLESILKNGIHRRGFFEKAQAFQQ